MNLFLADFSSLLNWWLIILVIGLLFLPLVSILFSNFYDRGYIFAKILGITTLSYFIFFLGFIKLISFTKINSILILILLVGLIFIFSKKIDKEINFVSLIKKYWRIFLLEELIFLATLAFWSYIKSFQPSIYGLEKYMDFGFINSIIRSDYFPPQDMWFTPLSINYYYFGHLITAVLTKISSIPASISYNLMLATIFAFTFTTSFSICLNLFFVASKKIQASIIAGLLSGFLIALAGNLHTIYVFFKPYDVEKPVPFWQLALDLTAIPNAYWYPNATRFIYNTIHEFPVYSFVVSDLHGHVFDIPIALTIIALLLNEFYSRSIRSYRYLVVSFLIAVCYMTNVWDGIIYFLLTILVLAVLNFVDFTKNISLKKQFSLYPFIFTILLVFAGFLLFSFPFSYSFKPFASGIGVLCAPDFLTDIGKIGPFLFEKDHCQRSPLWQLIILYGFFYFWAVSFLFFVFGKLSHWNLFRNWKLEIRNLQTSDLFILMLIFLSTLLIIIPEFIYIKDIYPAHYRANTMFKLVYQSFIMLSISSAYIAIRLILNIKFEISKIRDVKHKIFNFYYVYLLFAVLFFILVMIYPYFAINSYFDNLKNYRGLDGLQYLKNIYPTDYEAINWLNVNIKGQPVILEAQGDSYTDYARVSANTGLPTVLGWTVHEWLWRGTYDIPAPRIPEIQNLYETENLSEIKRLIERYNIKFVFIGTLERQKYQRLSEEKFAKLGKIVYQNGDTKIYIINN